jgi:H+-translocating NAD(P) transhydrogenase subunit alpha
MNIGIPKETRPGETRVALIPSLLPALLREKHEVILESGAGVASGFADDLYVKAGARVVKTAAAVYKEADIIIKVQPPAAVGARGTKELDMLRDGSTYIGYMAPLANADVVKAFAKKKITAFAMEYVPRITRAQSMDALSSMATIAGYKAVLISTEHLGKMFPLLMTAAGTIPPATVLILGAGVAGLQAIATAKRLGAKVEAFDPRPAVKDQVKSLGAAFVEMEMPADAETKGGYAKEMSAEFLKKEQEAIGARLPKVDVVICTAQVFGKRAPVLITKAMVDAMRPGCVIVDLAAEQGGNCELTKAGEVVRHNGVAIVGAVNLPATVPADASLMYAKNISNLFGTLFPKGAATPNFEDEVTVGACITRDGNIVNEGVKNALAAPVKATPSAKAAAPATKAAPRASRKKKK